MKFSVYPIIILCFASCCLGEHKCNTDDYSVNFRFSNSSGTNLVFGPNRIYDKNLIKFFTLNGNDTVFHRTAGYPLSGIDSVLNVQFDSRKFELVYVMLSNADIDTMQVKFDLVNGRTCCNDYTIVKSILYNNVVNTYSGVMNIVK